MLLILLVFFGSWFGILYLLAKKTNLDWDFGLITCCMLTILSFIILAATNILLSVDQVWDIEKMGVIDKQIALYEERVEDIGETLNFVLVEKYPTHEKEVFTNMKPDNLDILLIKYPELNTHKTFIEYSKHVRELVDKTYELRNEKYDLIAKLRYRRNNPFAIKFLIKKWEE